MIENVKDVLSYFGAEREAYCLMSSDSDALRRGRSDSDTLRRVFYKNTAGAWAKVEYRDAKGFLTIGSIVEGSDAEVVPRTLEFPFSAQDLARAIADVEMDAEDLWEEANC